MTLKEAIQLIPHGKCILFTGSGFSLEAKVIRKDSNGDFCKIRGAKDIALDLAKIADIADEDDLTLGAVSQYCKDNIPISTLIEFLRKEFKVCEITSDHEFIGTLQWRRIYTTNYDEIIEMAYKKNGRYINSISLDTPVSEVNKTKESCLHLNGIISELSEKTLDNSFKLTNRSYLHEDLIESPWFARFKDDMLDADAVFFIGFSGDYDLDIRRVFQSTKELREKSFFIIGTDAKKLAISKLSAFGNVEPIGLSGFVKNYKEIIGDNNRAVITAILPASYKCFRRTHIVSVGTNPSIQASHVIALLTKGEIFNSDLNISVREPLIYRYYIYRSKIDHVINLIEKNEKNILITSNLGNGKTLFVEGLSVKLERKGYSVFFFDKEREFAIDEVESICKDCEKSVLIFDNYVQNTQFIRKLTPYLSHETCLILTERTSRHETSYGNLDFMESMPYVIEIDRLNGTEIEMVVNLFDKFGLWRDKANFSNADKIRFVKENCKGQISELLLKMLEAEQLKDSYSKIVSAIMSREEYYQAILLILFSSYFGFKLEYGSFLESLSGGVLNNDAFKRNPNIKELVNFGEEQITFKSSILAQHILSKHIPKDDFVESYISIFKRLDSKYKSNKVIKTALKEMMKHSNLFRLFGNNRYIYKIYENISDCAFTQNHPLFWLQYAIAKTSDSDYKTAKIYFDTSYSCAESIDNYDTYQIDNHFAHFLFARALKNNDLGGSTAFEVFKEAHRKLKIRRKGDECRHYLYQVAQDYLPFFGKYKTDLESNEIVQYRKSCEEIIKMAEDYLKLPQTSRKDLVRACLDNLRRVVRENV